MKNLDLEKLWEVCNTLSEKESELSEHDTFVSLLGNRSSFSAYSFEQFLEYYAFKIEGDSIVVFNDDGIPYEEYTNNDFSYVPIILLSFGEDRLNSWMETEIKLELERQEREKVREKEDLKKQIELLTKKLESCN